MHELTEILSEGGFKSVDQQRKRLIEAGIKAQLVAPPGENLNA